MIPFLIKTKIFLSELQILLYYHIDLCKALNYNLNYKTLNWKRSDFMEIHEKIEFIRQQKGVTKTHIAQKCSKTPAWYTNVSKGKTKIDVQTLELIANSLDIDVKMLFDKELNDALNKCKEFL